MIPVSEPLLGARELEYVKDCLATGWISSAGRYIERFEQGWAAYCGASHGVAVSNGTTALQVALRCLRLQPGDEVILPTFTIVSCALAVVECGAVPVLVDSEPRTWCMDVAQVAGRITSRTRAIMVVHMYGHPVDMDPILALAAKHGLAVVEDAAEAHGAEYRSGWAEGPGQWRRCGGMGTLSTFSFYANKLITTGEGGMVLTSDPELAERARGLRNLCFLPARRFFHEELGYNFRLTNLQAALGVAQLERFEQIVEAKRATGRAYAAALQAMPEVETQVEREWARSVYWMNGLVLADAVPMEAPEVIRRLGQRGVEARPFFLGMHEQPVFVQRGLFRGERYPVAERIARRGLYLPSSVGLSREQLASSVGALREALS